MLLAKATRKCRCKVDNCPKCGAPVETAPALHYDGLPTPGGVLWQCMSWCKADGTLHESQHCKRVSAAKAEIEQLRNQRDWARASVRFLSSSAAFTNGEDHNAVYPLWLKTCQTHDDSKALRFALAEAAWTAVSEEVQDE